MAVIKGYLAVSDDGLGPPTHPCKLMGKVGQGEEEDGSSPKGRMDWVQQQLRLPNPNTLPRPDPTAWDDTDLLQQFRWHRSY